MAAKKSVTKKKASANTKNKQSGVSQQNSSNIFFRHKWWSAALLIVVIIFVLALLFGGWYSLWSKTLYTVGADNRVLIPSICQKACAKQDIETYCDKTQYISYGEEVRATFLRSAEPGQWKTVFTYTEKLNGTCNHIATGIIRGLNKQGVEEDFSVSFPYVEFPRCDHIDCNNR